MKHPSKLCTLLMNRDNLSREEAEQKIDTVHDMILNEVQDRPGSGFVETDDILMDELGVEPDYLFDILGI